MAQASTTRNTPPAPVVRLSKASLQLPTGRRLWQDLNLEVAPGEFLVVLGPNGAGKTTLLQMLLGLVPVNAGTAEVDGRPPRRGNPAIGYIPQQGTVATGLPVRGRDLVRLGLDGHRFGLSLPNPAAEAAVNHALHEVGAEAYADQPLSRLSGGEQQRLRIAQAVVARPQLLLCDEPLLSLDLAHQQAVSRLIDQQRRHAQAAVMLVTHDINPVLEYADRVLYLVRQGWAVGRPDDILTTATLTKLYDAPVEVLRVHGRVLVVSSTRAGAGTEGQATLSGGDHHHERTHDHAEGMTS